MNTTNTPAGPVAQLPGMDPRVFLAVALSGEQQRPGVPACVWINSATASATFKPLCDVYPTELREGLLKMHDEDQNASFLFVNQLGARVHVFKHAKASAAEALSGALTTT